MNNIILPTAAIQTAVDELPSLKQELFYREYSNKKKSTATSFILLIFSLHYAYLGKWLLQLIFWFTVGGCGIWWLIDLFKHRKYVTDWNHTLALDLLRRV